MGIGPQNLGASGMSSKSHACGSPLNKIKGGGTKDKKNQKRYNQIAKDLNVNTAQDTLIGPSRSHRHAQLRGRGFDNMQRMDGIESFSGNTPNPYKDIKGYRGKKGTEFYSIHNKNKYKK